MIRPPPTTDAADWTGSPHYNDRGGIVREFQQLVADPGIDANAARTLGSVLVAAADSLAAAGRRPEAIDHAAKQLMRIFAAGIQINPAALTSSDADWQRLTLVASTAPAVLDRIAVVPETLNYILHRSKASAQTLAPEIETSGAVAASRIRRNYAGRLVEIAVDEATDATITPAVIGRRIADAAGEAIDAALDNALHRWVAIRGLPLRPDGSSPQIAVLGTGVTGGGEMSYASPLRILFVYDSIDHRNMHQRQFYESLIEEVVHLIGGDPARHDTGIDIDLRDSPRWSFGGKLCSFFDAVQILENSGGFDQRLRMIKARPIAGSMALGDALVSRLNPWMYQSYWNRSDIGEAAAMVHRRQRRGESTDGQIDVLRDPGGLHEIQQTVAYLQLIHGDSLPTLRGPSTLDAIASLGSAGVLSDEQSAALADAFARLLRLYNQVWMTLGRNGSTLKIGEQRDADDFAPIAAAMGLTDRDDQSAGQRLHAAVNDTLHRSRELIDRVWTDPGGEADEAESILDPDPDPALVTTMLRRRGLTDSHVTLSHLQSLAAESVRFLSPHRCRHLFTQIASPLLDAISATPIPDRTLARIAAVAESLGAKASLWELFSQSPPTMELMVQMCSLAPALATILTDNPGMIDELIDSLLIDSLPSSAAVDARSVELCRGANEIDLILSGFRSGSHLTIGVRHLLGKEPIESTLSAVAGVSMACIHRVVQFEMAALGETYGDPVDANGKIMLPVILATGALGAGETDFSSTQRFLIIYSDDGETRRRVGGRRTTTTHQHFFHELSTRTISRLSSTAPGHLDIAAWSFPGCTDAAVALSSSMLQQRCNEAEVDASMALVRASLSAGSPRDIRGVASIVSSGIIGERTIERDAAVQHIQAARQRLANASHSENFRSGIGGWIDIETIASWLAVGQWQLGSAWPTSTVGIISELASRGILPADDALQMRENYRFMRQLGFNLELLEVTEPHELPTDPETAQDLAALMSLTATEIADQLNAIRTQNRNLYESWIPSGGTF